ncbi:unnamed protein product [Caenorhabditis brenneri]
MSFLDDTGTEKESLLDRLLRAQYPIDDTDPLENFPDIGEIVIAQMTGRIGFGQDVIQSAQKMFEEANGYQRLNGQKRKNNRFDVQKNDQMLQSSFSTSFHEPIAKKKFQQNGMDTSFSEPLTADAFFPQQTVGKERKPQRQINNLDRDIERLLQTVNRVYGPKEWTEAEKLEFSKYCKILRGGKLTDEDKTNLHNFYARVYLQQYQKDLGLNGPASEEVVKEILGSKSAICYPVQSGLLLNDSQKDLKKEDIIPMMPKANEPSSSVIGIARNYDPTLKNEKEKEFQQIISSMFTTVFKNSHHIPGSPNNHRSYNGELKELVHRLNKYMGENKNWNKNEIHELEMFYKSFKEKFMTIDDSNKFRMFLRSIYRNIEKQERKTVEFQEQKKNWQEDEKLHLGPEQGQLPSSSVESHIEQFNSMKEDLLDDKKQRKAAYLRQWRFAQKEKQMKSKGSDFYPVERRIDTIA